MLIVHKVRLACSSFQLKSLLTPLRCFSQFIRDHYHPRFPELDSLISAPSPFCKVILALGNGDELRGDLTGILASGAVMAVTVTAATSKGEVLSSQEWATVLDATKMMSGLDEAKQKVRFGSSSRKREKNRARGKLTFFLSPPPSSPPPPRLLLRFWITWNLESRCWLPTFRLSWVRRPRPRSSESPVDCTG